ncbi:MAG: N-acetyl-gamma-glutamyl-phosphate reductase [Gammaproteobacteria bacterium]|nr:N-acetyl-gamma-glutamyl-phosphate reductase [Gammaproteobacteria bacterium]
MIRAGVIGATGYTGAELLRLLSGHPHVKLHALTSRTDAGIRVADVFPWLRGRTELRYVPPDADQIRECDVVFFSTPNGTAMEQAPPLIRDGVRVVDLSADFRLRDPREWEQWYGIGHAAPELLEEAAYGLPEMFRDRIRGARLVANPGCYPTAIILGFLPLLKSGLVRPTGLIADAKSGVSGAGRKAELGILYSEVGESFKAYGVPGHRHLPEIRQTLATVAPDPVEITFVPHLVPMVRGIHATLYAELLSDADVQQAFERAYADEPFVDVLPPGAHPETRGVRGTNVCRIAVHRPSGTRVVVLSVIDNLVKGAAGQAIQNMNLMFDLSETAGLDAIAVAP